MARVMAMVTTRDRLRARSFYADVLGPVLGLGAPAIDEFGDQFPSGDGYIRLTMLIDERPSLHPVLGWQVEDAAACAAALVAKGVEMIIYPGMGQGDDGLWHSPDGHARVGWFNDSEGNLLSISQ
jgi:hypothetical protein